MNRPAKTAFGRSAVILTVAVLTVILIGCSPPPQEPEPDPSPTQVLSSAGGWRGLPERHYDEDKYIYTLKNTLIPKEIREIENAADGLLKEERFIRKKLAENPDNKEFLYLLAYNQFDRENYDSAMDSFEKILKNHPEEERAREGLVYCHYKKEDYRRARRMATEALKKYPKNPRLLHMLAGSFLYGERNPKTAAEIYEKALKIDSDDPRIWLGLAESWVEMKTPGASDRAVEIMEETIRRFPRYHIVYILLAEELQLKGRYGEALQRLEEAIERDPLYYRGYSIIGDIFTDIRRDEEALKYYLKTVETNPLYESLIFVRLGDYYRDRGDEKAAAEYYRKALSIRDEKEDEPNQDSAGACIGLALMDIEAGRLDAAKGHIDRAHRDYPQYEYNITALSALHVAKGQYDKARSLLLSAEKLPPENRPGQYEILYGLARIHAMEGKTGKAAACLEKAVSLLPSFRRLHILNRIERDKAFKNCRKDPSFKHFEDMARTLLKEAESLKLKKRYVE